LIIKGGNSMGKVKRILDKSVDFTTILILIVLVCVTFLQVIGRYIFQNPPAWTEELARYLAVWLTFLGAAMAFRSGNHLGIDFFTSMMPKGLQKVVSIVISLLLCSILAIFVWKGYNMADFVSRQLSPAMRISMKIPYAAIPVGSALMLFEVINNLYRTLLRREEV